MISKMNIRIPGEAPLRKIRPRKCRAKCIQEENCRPECFHKKNPCKQNCCDRLTLRRNQLKQAQANSSVMQKQLASALTMTIPKYSRRPKPTPGKGHGCGAPPRQTLPPLWMYSMGKKRTHSTAPLRPIGKMRGQKTPPNTSMPFNRATEDGTHRFYIHH